MSGYNDKWIKYDFVYMTKTILEPTRLISEYEAKCSFENVDIHLKDYTVSQSIQLPLWENENEYNSAFQSDQ